VETTQDNFDTRLQRRPLSEPAVFATVYNTSIYEGLKSHDSTSDALALKSTVSSPAHSTSVVNLLPIERELTITRKKLPAANSKAMATQLVNAEEATAPRRQSDILASASTAVDSLTESQQVGPSRSMGSVHGPIAVELERTLIASASADKKLILWNWSTGKICRVLLGHSDGLTAVSSPNGYLLASGSNDMTVKIGT
jgi:WD40 repeat protein